MNILSLENVGFSYGDDFRLKAGSFDISEGGFLGIGGPNGSGKTTLLHIIGGILNDYTGTVKFRNEDILKIPDKKRARLIGIVPQYSHFFFSISVLACVLQGRTPYLKGPSFESEDDLSRAKKALRMTGVKHLSDRPVSDISGGEFRRVLLARALTQDPDLLLLDEPTANLDLNVRFEIMNLIRDLNKEGLTVIAVSHNINLLSRYTKELILMKDGALKAIGKTEKILRSDILKSVFEIDIQTFKDRKEGFIRILPRIFNSQNLKE